VAGVTGHRTNENMDKLAACFLNQAAIWHPAALLPQSAGSRFDRKEDLC
jgi:hypothetical protein